MTAGARTAITRLGPRAGRGAGRRSRSLARRVVRAGMVLGLAVVAVLGTATTAAAHAQLLSTSPAAGADVAKPPAAVTLTFNQTVLAIGAFVRVDGPRGNIAAGAPVIQDDRVRQALTPAAAGLYRVAWRVTSIDGHPIGSTFSFTVTGGTGSRPEATTSATPAPTGSTQDSSRPPGTGTSDDAGRRRILVTGSIALAVFMISAVGGVLIASAARRRQAATRHDRQ